MKQKQARWYKVIDNKAYIYDTPYPKNSLLVSIIDITELSYYRSNFDLQKVWIDYMTD